MDNSKHSRMPSSRFTTPEKLLQDTGEYLFNVHKSSKVNRDNTSLKSSTQSLTTSKSKLARKGKNCETDRDVDFGGFSTAHALSFSTRSLKQDKNRIKKQTTDYQQHASLVEDLRRRSLLKNKKKSNFVRKPDTLKKMRDTADVFDNFEKLFQDDHDNVDDEASFSDLSGTSTSTTTGGRNQKLSTALEMAMTISKRNSVIQSIKDFSEHFDDNEITTGTGNSDANKDLPSSVNPSLDGYSTDASFSSQETNNSSIASTTSNVHEQSGSIEFRQSLPKPSGFEHCSEKTPLFFFERKRVAAVDRKITLTVIFLRTYAVVLKEGVEELARVEALVDGTARANQAFSQSLKNTLGKSLGQDMLVPDSGEVSSHSYASAVSTNSCKSFQEPLDSLFTSQNLIAEQFSDNASHSFSSIIQEITDLREETDGRSKYIEQMGDTLVHAFERVEEFLQKCWQLYNEAAVEASSDNSKRLLASPHSNTSDLWLLELRYRVSVAYQASLWKSISVRLSELFRSGREKESERRVRLQALLLDFVSKQKRMIASCSSTHPEILQELLDRSEEEEIEIDIVNTLQRHVEPFDRWENKPLLCRSQSLKESEEQALCSLDTLESPLSSELVTASKIVERKIKNSFVTSGWQRMMAITTTTGSIHLFKVPDDVVRDAELEDTFLALLPDPQVPEAIDQKLENHDNINELLDISPAETFFLPECDVSNMEGLSSGHMKIIEHRAVESSTRNFFQKSGYREVVLRALIFDSDNSDEWCEFNDTSDSDVSHKISHTMK